MQGLLPAGGVPRDQTEVQEEVAQGLLRGQDGKVQAGVSFLLNLQRNFQGSDGCVFSAMVFGRRMEVVARPPEEEEEVAEDAWSSEDDD